jgi:hypothetical protein
VNSQAKAKGEREWGARRQSTYGEKRHGEMLESGEGKMKTITNGHHRRYREYVLQR